MNKEINLGEPTYQEILMEQYLEEERIIKEYLER